ncbi:MAG: hypothetical protein Q8L48_24785 [Archangium sp.]|nr:hypothetical protein [Archangium sp.]
MTPQLRTRLNKLANDNGFDRALDEHESWLHFASTQAALELWLTDGFVAAFSQAHVVAAMGEHGSATNTSLPAGASAALAASDLAALHRLVRRAFQLSRSLPDAPLLAFERDLDAVFDDGYVTVQDDGAVVISSVLPETA